MKSLPPIASGPPLQRSARVHRHDTPRQRPLFGIARQPLLAAFLMSVGLIGCSPADNAASQEADSKRVHGLTAKEASEVIARVGDVEITAGDLAARLAEQSPYIRAQYETPERRREFLENMVRFELLAQEARERGLYELPEVERARKQAMIEELLSEEVGDEVELSSISDEEVRTYYEAHRDEFNKSAQVRASQIVVAQKAKAEKLLAELAAAPENAELFRQRVAEHSVDRTSRERQGDLGFFSLPGLETKPEVPAVVAEAAFTIETVGGVYPQLLEVEKSYIIIKLTARREALHRSVDEARPMIQHRLWRKKRKEATDKLIARLRQEAKLTKDESALDEIQLDLPGTTSAEDGNRATPR